MKNEFNKFPIGEIICALVCVLLSVLSIVLSITCAATGSSSISWAEGLWIAPMLFLLVISVISLAGLTLKKASIIKAFVIIYLIAMSVLVGVLTISYAINVVTFAINNPTGNNWFYISCFATILTLLVVFILYFVYYIAYAKGAGNKMLLAISTGCVSALLLVYAVLQMVYVFGKMSDYSFLPLHYVTMTVALLVFSLIPLFLSFDLDRHEKPEMQIKEEEKTAVEANKPEEIKEEKK